MAGDYSHRMLNFFRRRANIDEEESSDDSDEELHAFEQQEMHNTTQLLNMIVSSSIVQPRTRINIHRNREMAHNDLVRDYFAPNCTYPPHMFRRRFRMRRELFLRIKDDLEAADTYFQRLPDCTGRLGLSAIQKITAALRILAYGGPMDSIDEYIKIGESTAKVALTKFCENILVLYTDQYLRTPTMNDTMHLMEENATRGFPGMIGSLDCMHWEWRGCPTAWKGQYLGHTGSATIILEAVASYDLWIWHAFFGMAGSHNDITVLRHSHIFNEFIRGRTPNVPFLVNGLVYHTPYYLTDGIYPRYAALMQSILHPHTPVEKVFARTHEAVRKDVERAFGVLQAKWGITKGPVRYFKTSELKKIMLTCIILHNMIIDDERHLDLDPWTPPSDEVVSTIENITNPEVLAHYIHARMEQIRDDQINTCLKRDLMAHIWSLHGNLEI